MALYGRKKDLKQKEKRGFSLPKGQVSIIAEGTIIDGVVRMSCDVRIDGEITGDVYSEYKVIIGESGCVVGDLYCNVLELSGAIEGEVYCKTSSRLHPGSSLKGNLTAPSISMERGSIFLGIATKEFKTPFQIPTRSSKKVQSSVILREDEIRKLKDSSAHLIAEEKSGYKNGVNVIENSTVKESSSSVVIPDPILKEKVEIIRNEESQNEAHQEQVANIETAVETAVTDKRKQFVFGGVFKKRRENNDEEQESLRLSKDNKVGDEAQVFNVNDKKSLEAAVDEHDHNNRRKENKRLDPKTFLKENVQSDSRKMTREERLEVFRAKLKERQKAADLERQHRLERIRKNENLRKMGQKLSNERQEEPKQNEVAVAERVEKESGQNKERITVERVKEFLAKREEKRENKAERKDEKNIVQKQEYRQPVPEILEKQMKFSEESTKEKISKVNEEDTSVQSERREEKVLIREAEQESRRTVYRPRLVTLKGGRGYDSAPPQQEQHSQDDSYIRRFGGASQSVSSGTPDFPEI